MSVLLWTAVTAFAATPVPQAGAPSAEVAQAATTPAQAVPPVVEPPIDPTVPVIIPEPFVQTEPVPAIPSTDTAAKPAAQQGDVTVTGRSRADALDPLRAVNAKSFEATQAVDDAIVAPIALAYKKTAPKPFRSGVHNILYNLREPVVFVNFLLQHKIGKAAETVGRFAINSTVGVLGAFDVAKRKPFKLPRRGNGFADTLGFYGVPNGPFLFLPLVGPTTVRDLFGGAVDRLILPVAFGNRVTRPEVAVPLGVLGVLDHRSEFDDTLHALHDNAADPYANTRAFYLQRRQAEIDHLRGKDTGASSPMSEAPKAPIDPKGREVKRP